MSDTPTRGNAHANNPENASGNIRASRDAKSGQFLQGSTGNPNGRPRGSRNKLAGALIDALHEDFEKHGVAAIQKVREEDPAAYLRTICAVLPKDLEMTLTINHELFVEVENFRQAYEYALQTIGADEPALIEHDENADE